MVSSCALYYPTIDICDEAWLKNAYLFWDGIRTIVPQSLEGKAYHNNTSRFLSDQISKSSTILIGLKQCLGKTIHRGMKVMIAGFGVGLSWAGTMLKF